MDKPTVGNLQTTWVLVSETMDLGVVNVGLVNVDWVLISGINVCLSNNASETCSHETSLR